MIKEINQTKLDGVLEIIRDTWFDERGNYQEIFNTEEWNKKRILSMPPAEAFIQTDTSTSFKYVLRGFHGDQETFKLTQCLHGTIYSVIINNIPEHPQYRQWQAFTLSPESRRTLLIPPGFGNSILILSDIGIYMYLQSTQYRGKDYQFTLNVWDPGLNIYWPIRREQAIMSQRDATAPLIKTP